MHLTASPCYLLFRPDRTMAFWRSKLLSTCYRLQDPCRQVCERYVLRSADKPTTFRLGDRTIHSRSTISTHTRGENS